MFELSSAQRAAIQTGIHDGLGLPLGRPDTKVEMQMAAYAEIVSNPDWASDTLALAEAIDSAILLTRKSDLSVDPSEVMEVHAKPMVRLSLMYAGVSPVAKGNKEIWMVGRGGNEVLKLPATILDDWNID